MLRLYSLILSALILAGCTNANDLDRAPVDLGDFHLGHNIVVAPNLTRGPASREATQEEWIEAMKAAMEERFGRYEGQALYHFGVSVEGYVLAVPGVPVVASPKSVLILKATVWDDAAGKKLNDKPETITVVETISGNTFIGSGVTQSKEVQMRNLSRNAAKQIQNWMVRQRAEKGWFTPEPDAADAATKAAPETLPEAPSDA